MRTLTPRSAHGDLSPGLPGIEQMEANDASQRILRSSATSAQLREQLRPDADLTARHRKCNRQDKGYELLGHDENVKPPDKISQGESPEGSSADLADHARDDH